MKPTIIACMLTIALAALCLFAAPPQPINYLVIGMTQSRWDNPTVKNAVGTALARIYYRLSTNDTPTAEQKAYALSGWVNNYRVTANTNVTVWVFCDSVQNLVGMDKSGALTRK